MLQKYLTRFTRLELLKLLVRTQTSSLLKLFRQYNGLEILASYMCDAEPTDWEVKHQILLCLEHIPISAQKQVQKDSSLMDFVRQWTLDPRYCRSRGPPAPTNAEQKEPEAVPTPQDDAKSTEPKNNEEDSRQLEQEQLKEEIIVANRVRVYPPAEEAAIIEDIRQLAGRILENWLKLPVHSSLPHEYFFHLLRICTNASTNIFFPFFCSRSPTEFPDLNARPRNSRFHNHRSLLSSPTMFRLPMRVCETLPLPYLSEGKKRYLTILLFLFRCLSILAIGVKEV